MKAAVLKTVERLRVPGVRIPPSPPLLLEHTEMKTKPILTKSALAIFISLSGATALHSAETSAAVSAVEYDPARREIILDNIRVKFGFEMECGLFDDQALYASFGLERQIYKCSKILLPIALKTGKWFGRLELAPLYDSVKRESETYFEDAEFKTRVISYKGNIDGNNPYYDWYKNLGSRTYFVDDYPLREAYIGYNFGKSHRLIAGRIRHSVGFSDDELPWEDDAKFSPYANWLSRDLLSGIIYTMHHRLLGVRAGVLAGNNPAKAYGNYLGGIQNANLKANNTPSLSLNLDFNIGRLFGENKSKLFVGGIRNIAGSTYDEDINDGKRRNSTYVFGGKLNFPLSAVNINLYGQYTKYLSGLSEDSAQAQVKPENPIFRNIEQDGYYYAGEVSYRQIRAYYAYEKFDRFDFNVDDRIEEKCDSPPPDLQGLKQESRIFGFDYLVNDAVYFRLAYHKINNPLQCVSDILDRSDDRFKATLSVNF